MGKVRDRVGPDKGLTKGGKERQQCDRRKGRISKMGGRGGGEGGGVQTWPE